MRTWPALSTMRSSNHSDRPWLSSSQTNLVASVVLGMPWSPMAFSMRRNLPYSGSLSSILPLEKATSEREGWSTRGGAVMA